MVICQLAVISCFAGEGVEEEGGEGGGSDGSFEEQETRGCPRS